ncbi:MAG: hypothetical protein WKF79_15350 [Nocardioides sp.]
MTMVIILLLLAGLVVAVGVTNKRKQARELERKQEELEPVKKLAFEDITALGVQLQDFDSEVAGQKLDVGANADYQRALDAYESAKTAGDRIEEPDDIRNITTILDDGRYAIACVRARVEGEPLPTRRPPCFFDPRHGLSIEDVPYTPPGGAPRDVPACALDAERVHAGAEPDSRMVMVGSRRVPYYEGGSAYQPYAAGYFGMGAMNMMFMGMMFGGMGGFGGGFGGDGGGDAGSGGGDAGGDGGGFGDFDFGGFDF